MAAGDFADEDGGLAGFGEAVEEDAAVVGAGGDDHADAHVEGALHFGEFDLAGGLDETEEGGHFPSVAVDGGAGAFGEHSGEVVGDAAAGDVGEAEDEAFADEGEEAFCVATMRGKESIGESCFVLGGEGIPEAEAADFEEGAAGEGKAVGVESVAGEADEDVAFGDVGAGEPVFGVHDADETAYDVNFAVVVDAGHLGGFPADEGDTEGGAGFGHAGDDLGKDGAFELGAAVVIEEEEGAGALAEGVVGAVVDDIEAEIFELAGHGRDFGFGADAVNGGDEGGASEFGEAGIEDGPETADTAEDAGGVGGFDSGGNALEGTSGFINVDS